MATGLVRLRTQIFYTNHSVKHYIVQTIFNTIDGKGVISVELSFPLNFYLKDKVVEQKVIKKDYFKNHRAMVKKYDDLIKKEEEHLYGEKKK